ncbi:hypothetical protein OAU50_06495 [Planctomycetota bacterium]|nr:hypothetical protein [Planctomycetota bacterium]
MVEIEIVRVFACAEKNDCDKITAMNRNSHRTIGLALAAFVLVTYFLPTDVSSIPPKSLAADVPQTVTVKNLEQAIAAKDEPWVQVNLDKAEDALPIFLEVLKNQKLVKLHAASTPVSHKSIWSLIGKHPTLKVLRITYLDANQTDDWDEYLEQLEESKIEELSLEYVGGANSAWMESIAKMQHLACLLVSYVGNVISAPKPSTVRWKLKTLDFTRNCEALSDEWYVLFGGSKYLKDLSLGHPRITDKRCEVLSGSKSLINLKLFSIVPDAECPEPLSKLDLGHDLVSLDVSTSIRTDLEIATVLANNKPRSIRLAGLQLKGDIFDAVEDWSFLVSLSLYDEDSEFVTSSWSNESLEKAINTMSKLKSVLLQGGKLCKPQLVTKMLTCGKIEDLRVFGCEQFSKSQIDTIIETKSVLCLMLTNATQLSDEDVVSSTDKFYKLRKGQVGAEITIGR